jgi:hypothetical protein
MADIIDRFVQRRTLEFGLLSSRAMRDVALLGDGKHQYQVHQTSRPASIRMPAHGTAGNTRGGNR